MGFGFAVLRLSPDAFWRMTLNELAAAAAALAPPAAERLARDGLERLMRRFPDEPPRGS
jgi:uncharacterized phage protein (TIGR02216 family)